MNQMDENYWQKLAQDWIKRQSQQNEIPEAPKISFSDTGDNLAVADMEIEDVKEEQSLTTQIFANDQHPAIFSNKLQEINQLAQSFPSSSSKFHKQQDAPRRTFSQHQYPLVIPEPPSISLMQDHIKSIDMEMDDSENDDDSNSAGSFNMMEIAKRKKLPIWIREGLEKMKREKELEEARLMEEQKRKEDEENRKKIYLEALNEIQKEKISKSKYESSDSDNEETDSKIPPQHKVESNENDEEAYENMMLLVRKTLTSVLLEVTDEKIQEISNETLSKYRKKASETTKPALMKLGLGAYSSSTEDEDSGDEGSSDWEAESVIKERIRQKQITFEKRVKERLERHQSELDGMEKFKRRNSSSKSEPEQSKHSIKAKYSDSDDDNDDANKQKLKSSRKDGEEKFETQKYEIYSISKSSGPIVRVPREKRTRFSDPKDGKSTTHMTHLGMVDSSSVDNGANIAPKLVIQPPPPVVEMPKTSESPKKEKKDKKKRRSTSSSSSSSDSGHRKKHKKHKKSSKHSKKSSKKKDRSRSRSRDRDREKRHHSSRSDRHSIESKTSIRSSESSRRRSRSRSRSRDRHRSRY